MTVKVQLIVARERVTTIYFPSSKVGEAVWVDEPAARELLELGVCKWPDGQSAAAPVKQGEPLGGAAEEKKPLRRKPGWPVDRFSEVLPVWRGDVVLCIGGGPSVTKEAVDLARGRCRAVAINDSYLIAPWADVCYFADYQWWEWHAKGIAKNLPWGSFSSTQVRQAFDGFAGQKVTIQETGMRVPDPEVHMLHNDHASGLSQKADTISPGGNSGYQTLNLVLHARPRKVLLLGYDMRFPKGRSHWHGGHPFNGNEAAYARYARRFNVVPPLLKHFGTEVVNCTPGSAIGCFRFSTVARELG